MRRGRSTGKKTPTQQARLAAIKETGRIACRRTRLVLVAVRTEFWSMAGQNRRVA